MSGDIRNVGPSQSLSVVEVKELYKFCVCSFIIDGYWVLVQNPESIIKVHLIKTFY